MNARLPIPDHRLNQEILDFQCGTKFNYCRIPDLARGKATFFMHRTRAARARVRSGRSGLRSPRKRGGADFFPGYVLDLVWWVVWAESPVQI